MTTVLMRLPMLAAAMLPHLMRLSESREPDFEVIRGGDRKVYLRRWWLIPRNDDGNLYLHNMLADDDEILHDHMYESWSLVLTPGLEEVSQPHPENYGRADLFPMAQRRTFEAGDVVYRTEHMAHRLIVRKPAWTLFATGPRVREWGFWCPRGFRHWRDYVEKTQDPSVRGGSRETSGRGQGCGEMS